MKWAQELDTDSTSNAPPFNLVQVLGVNWEELGPEALDRCYNTIRYMAITFILACDIGSTCRNERSTKRIIGESCSERDFPKNILPWKQSKLIVKFNETCSVIIMHDKSNLIMLSQEDIHTT